MYSPARRQDGTSINKGDWIHIKFSDGAEYVGRFSGIYNNPHHGLMYYIAFARRTDGSSPPEAIYCVIRETNDFREALETAIPIEKPKIRAGKPVIRPCRPSDARLH